MGTTTCSTFVVLWFLMDNFSNNWRFSSFSPKLNPKLIGDQVIKPTPILLYNSAMNNSTFSRWNQWYSLSSMVGPINRNSLDWKTTSFALKGIWLKNNVQLIDFVSLISWVFCDFHNCFQVSANGRRQFLSNLSKMSILEKNRLICRFWKFLLISYYFCQNSECFVDFESYSFF